MTRKITKSEWLDANGFSEFGVTYLVLGNSYPIKDELKDSGFKFSPLLRWHGPSNDYELPETCKYYELNYNDVFTWEEESHTTFMKEGARDKIEAIFNPIVESDSVFVGEIGDRIREIPMTIRNVSGFDSAYGYKYVYTFEDADGNVYSWFTTSQQQVVVGMSCLVTGTIKAHVEYRKVFTTQLTRCILKIL